MPWTYRLMIDVFPVPISPTTSTLNRCSFKSTFCAPFTCRFFWLKAGGKEERGKKEKVVVSSDAKKRGSFLLPPRQFNASGMWLVRRARSPLKKACPEGAGPFVRPLCAFATADDGLTRTSRQSHLAEGEKSHVWCWIFCGAMTKNIATPRVRSSTR